MAMPKGDRNEQGAGVVAANAKWAALLVAAGVAIAATPVQAISRYTSTSMTCSAIHATVLSDGAAILRWIQPPDILRYGRYVANSGFCDYGERAVASPVPSADEPRCVVYECKRFDPDQFDFFGFGPR